MFVLILRERMRLLALKFRLVDDFYAEMAKLGTLFGERGVVERAYCIAQLCVVVVGKCPTSEGSCVVFVSNGLLVIAQIYWKEEKRFVLSAQNEICVHRGAVVVVKISRHYRFLCEKRKSCILFAKWQAPCEEFLRGSCKVARVS